MKTIFKKSHLPFIRHTLSNGSGRDNWNLARTMQDENGLQHQLPAEIMLLEKGANQNDPWSMCELARTYFHHCGDLFLPKALHIAIYISSCSNCILFFIFSRSFKISFTSHIKKESIGIL